MDDLIDWQTTERLRSDVAQLLTRFPDTNTFLGRIADRLEELCEKYNWSTPSASICRPFVEAASFLYKAEHLNAPPSQFSAALIDTMEGAHYRDELLALYHKAKSPETTLDALSHALINSFLGLIQHLPPTAWQEPSNDSILLPIVDCFDVAQTVNDVMRPFLNDGLAHLGIFSQIQAQLQKNQLDASGGNPKKLISPLEFEGTPRETIHAFLKDTPLAAYFTSEIPFRLPDEARFSGMWCVAPSGRGKTTLLHNMFLNDIQRDASVIVMDSKGDLINPIKSMAAIADRLILIEPDSKHPLALNPLDVPSESIPHTIALIEYILSGLLEAKFTNLQSALFRHVLPAIMQAIPHPTLEDLKRVLANGLTPEQNPKLDSRLRAFFDDRHSGFYSKTYAETRSQIIWRLDFILTNDTMRAMFESPTTRLKLGEAMNSGKVIIIDASKALLGDDGSEFYQRFFLALILAAAQQRAKLKPSDKLPVYVYLDECQWVRNDQKLATILDECRSQKIALILAHQRTEQITNPNVLSAMANCAIRFANSDDEAKYLAPKLRCEPEFLYSLPRGTFAAFVRDLTPHAVALQVPYTDIEALPRMSSEQQTAIRERMRKDYGFIPQPTSSSPPTFSAPPGPAVDTRPPDSTASEKPSTPHSASDTPESGSTW